MKTRDLVVTRVFDAPVERLWDAWTNPEHVIRWWGPAEFTPSVAKLDVREGGTSLVGVRSPNGRDFYNTWTYRKIAPHRRIEFVQDWADHDGAKVDPVQLGLPRDLPRELRHLVVFVSLSDTKTEMSVIEYGYTSKQTLEVSRAKLEQSLQRMAASLS
ncbi:MAG: SRPBCC family protein [Gemmatimonadota bacterium]